MLLLVVVGIIGYSRLPVQELPNINNPVVSVRASLTGAGAQLMETAVTTPIENALADISGINYIKSDSEQGSSRISIHFNLGVDANQAADEVRNKIAGVFRYLPKGIDMPTVSKSDSDADSSMILSVTDDQKSPEELGDYVNRYLLPPLEQVNGVSTLQLYGDRSFAMRIWLDPWKMAMRQVTVPDVIAAIDAQTQNLPGGQIKGQQRYVSVLTQTGIHSPKQFNHLIIRDQDGYLLRIQDIGTAELAPETTDDAMRVNGKTALGIGVVTDAEANPISVTQQVLKKLKNLKPMFPPGMNVNVVYNESDYIKASLNNVYEAIVEALILVVLVVWLFLGSFRSALIPIITIPICLIGIFGFLYLVGFSINLMTLLALVLAIGLVVDDAIVMLENIYRHVERGMPPLEAAITGSKEIAFAVIAMTLTLAAVYAPTAFASGFTGVIFLQFAFTLAVVVIISGFVALTLSPMMCARILKISAKPNKLQQGFTSGFEKIAANYRRALTYCLRRKYLVIIPLLLIAFIGVYLYTILPSQLAPPEDEGVIKVHIEGPTNAGFDYMNKYTKQVENIIARFPQVTNYTVWVGGSDVNEAFVYVVLKPWDERKLSQQAIVKEMDKQFKKVIGVRVVAINSAPLGSHEKEGGSFEFVVMTADSYLSLYHLLSNLTAIFAENPGFLNVESNLKMNNEQYNIDVDKSLAATMGVNLGDVANTIATMLGGSTITNFNYDNYNYDVILQMREDSLRQLGVVNHLFVAGKNQQMIPLSAIVNVKNSVGPLELYHYNRMRAAEISAQLAPGFTMSDAINYAKQVAKNHLPSGDQYAFSGDAKRMLEAHHELQLVFILALIFIYLILAAQFESFVDPLAILLGVPLTIVGALFSLKVTGNSLNIYSQIGLITLIGLIAKHGILIVEFANQLRPRGMLALDRVVEAASMRLRPILMTTAAMVLGAIPLAFATGAGAHGRQAIGWVIVGGMLFGTFFSLFVVPVAYVLLAKLQPASSK